MASIALAQHHRTSGSAGTAPRRRGPDPAGAPLAFERARPSGRRQHCSAQNAGSIHDWVVRRVETARISLECTPGFRLNPGEVQNGALPGYRQSCTGSSLSTLCKAGSGFPVDSCASEAAPLLRGQGRVDGMVDGAVGDIPMRDGRPLGDLKRCAGEAHLVVGISVFV